MPPDIRSQMNRIGQLCLVICIFFSTSSCGDNAKGQLFHKASIENSEKAKVYVYRLYLYCWGQRKPDLYLNGRYKLKLLNEGFAEFVLPAGKYEFKARGTADMKTLGINLEVYPAKTYYLKYDVNCEPWLGPFGYGPLRFYEVGEPIALPEISKCKAIGTSQFTQD